MKRVLHIIIILSIIQSITYSQDFQKIYISQTDEIFNDIILTQDGSYLIIGTKINETTDSSLVIMKLKQNGDTIWRKNYIFENGFNPSSIIQLDNGSFLLTGSELRNIQNKGHSRVEIILDPNGEIISNLAHPDQRRGDQIQHIYTSDNSYVFISNTGYPTGVQGIQFMKRKFNFDKMWNRIWERKNTDLGKKVFELENGSYLILGETYSLGVRKDILLLKFTQKGQLQWAKALGKDQNESLNSAWLNADGSIVIVGSTNSFSGNVLREEILTTKIDTSGNIIWSKTYSSSGTSKGKSIHKIGANYHLLAEHNDLAGNNSNMIYLQIDEEGKLIESSYFSIETICNMKLLQSFNGEILIGCTKNIESKLFICLIKTTECNNCNSSWSLTEKDVQLNTIVDPSSDYSSIFGGSEEVLTSSKNSEIVSIGNTCLVAENNHTSFNNIQIFPNPVNKIINITGLTVPAFVEVYDINGKLLISTIQEWQDSTINVEHLVNGFYIIKIHNSKNYSAYKIFKM